MTDFAARLEAARRALQGEIARDEAALAIPVEERGEDSTPSQHPADVASDLFARESVLTAEQSLREELASVEEALARLRTGTYGICVDCGTTIAPARLEAQPHAARCLPCQVRAEATAS